MDLNLVCCHGKWVEFKHNSSDTCVTCPIVNKKYTLVDFDNFFKNPDMMKIIGMS